MLIRNSCSFVCAHENSDHFLFYWTNYFKKSIFQKRKKNIQTVMVINSTNTNKMSYHLSPTIIEEDIYGIDKSRLWIVTSTTRTKKNNILTHNKRGFMMFNATFNNISAVSWRSVLLVVETGVPGENHRPVASHWQTSKHNVVSSTPHQERGSNLQPTYWWHSCTHIKYTYHLLLDML